MVKRAYGQFCGLARALEIVGERWALLIVRDLLVSPKRYTDLRRGLPGIPTNILSSRLKELEAHRVLQRRVLPRPDGSIVYELTEYGSDLQEAVLGLGRWGARSLGDARPGEVVTADSLTMAIRTTFHREAAKGLTIGYELHVGEITLAINIDDGSLEAGPGPLPDADLIIETGLEIKALMAAELTPTDAITSRGVRLTGNPDLLTQFTEIFHI
jgi:DNA-binding HxlR family transcriptional regulator